MFIKTTYFIYTIILFVSIFGGGSIIKVYGETCGLSILSPSEWGRSLMLMGSPWCRGLNWMSYIVSNIIENIWYHGIASCVGLIYNYSDIKGTNSSQGPIINMRTKVN